MNCFKKFSLLLCPLLLLSVMPVQSGTIFSKSAPYIFSSAVCSVCVWAVINQNEKLEKHTRRIKELEAYKEQAETNNADRKKAFDLLKADCELVNRKVEEAKIDIDALKTDVKKVENSLNDYDLSGQVTISQFKEAFGKLNVSFTDPAQELAELAFAIKTFCPRVDELPAKLKALSQTAETAKQQTLNNVGDLARMRSSIEKLQNTTNDLSSSFVEIKKHEPIVNSSVPENKTENKIENKD